jgi:hypothetical protein
VGVRLSQNLCNKSGVADLKIAGLRRRDRRKQPTIGFEIG